MAQRFAILDATLNYRIVSFARFVPLRETPTQTACDACQKGRILRLKERHMNLYVGNLTYEANETDIKAAFEPFGQISEVRVITDRYSGRSRGFAFVEMPNQQEAEAAIQGLNGQPLQGRPLTVNEAKPRGSGDRRDSGPRRW